MSPTGLGHCRSASVYLFHKWLEQHTHIYSQNMIFNDWNYFGYSINLFDDRKWKCTGIYIILICNKKNSNRQVRSKRESYALNLYPTIGCKCYTLVVSLEEYIYIYTYHTLHFKQHIILLSSLLLLVILGKRREWMEWKGRF